jgi:tRNA threonylcarbamoyladenosine biosynthesis protein TsaB
MCHPEKEMLESQPVAKSKSEAMRLALGVDTCGPSGTVALARIDGESVAILGQKSLAGRTYSATLVAKIAEILNESGTELRDLNAIVVVNGPGSFTGVRVGLSAVKGLAEPFQTPVAAVSRLAVLAAKAGLRSAALDAHRHEVFLRLEGPGGSPPELLAGAEELAKFPRPARLAICDDPARALLEAAWPKTDLAKVEAPTAAEAIKLCFPRILAGDFDDVATLDGHYLRRSDAEIFGQMPHATISDSRRFLVRAMTVGDLDGVMAIAAAAHNGPVWRREDYEKALDANGQPRRIALVAEALQSGAMAGFAVASVMAPEAELESIVTALAHQRQGVARELFSVLKSQLRRQGAREVILEVRAGNRAALGFYRFLGFGEEGRRPGYYADPVEDAILMRVRLM